MINIKTSVPTCVKHYIRPNELLVFLAFGLFLCKGIYLKTLFERLFEVTPFSPYIDVITAGLLFVGIILEDELDHIYIYLLMAALFLISAFSSSGIRELGLIVLFIFASRNINQDKMLKISIAIIAAYLIICAAFYYAGFFERIDNAALFYRSDTIRESMGFSYVTFAPNLFMSLVLCWLYIKQNSVLSIAIFFILAAVNWILYAATDTRAVFFIVSALLLLALFIRERRYRFLSRPFTKFLASLVYPCCAALIAALTFAYDIENDFLVAVDSFLSGRLALGKLAMETYPVKAFGNVTEFVGLEDAQLEGEEYFYVDSSYLQILIKYGWVILLVVLVIMIMLIRFEAQRRNLMRVIVLIAVAGHSMTDPQLLSLVYTPFLLYIGRVIREKAGGGEYAPSRRAGRPFASSQQKT